MSWKFRLYGLVSAVILGILTFGQIPTHSTTDTARVVKYAQNDIVPAKGRPTDASEMAKRWFKSQLFGSLPLSSHSLWEQQPSLLGCPKKMGQKKENQKCRTYMLSGIGRACSSPADVRVIRAQPCFDGQSWNGDLRRRSQRA